VYAVKMKMARISASMPGRTRAIVKVGRKTLVRGLGSLNGTRAEERGCYSRGPRKLPLSSPARPAAAPRRHAVGKDAH
jgi:hypothetical protein